MTLYHACISSTEREYIATELLYAIAAAKGAGAALLRLRYTDRTQGDVLSRLLRSLKKQGSVAFSIASVALDDGSAEASFLSNKYPSALKEAKEDGVLFYLIRL